MWNSGYLLKLRGRFGRYISIEGSTPHYERKRPMITSSMIRAERTSRRAFAIVIFVSAYLHFVLNVIA